MIRQRRMQWAVVFLAACSSPKFGESDDGVLGAARVSLETAPADVQCVEIVAAGSSVVTRAFDVEPGQGSVFDLEGLPLGQVAFSGEAFPVACSEVTAGTAPFWVADPVSETLVAGVVAEVTLSMRRNGQASVAVDFAAEGTCTNGVQDGLETGVDCGGDCLPCAAPENEQARTLLFSEYVEGSSTHKALEITALTDASFEGCRVAVYFNGETTATGVALSGALLAGESHVICSSSLSSVTSSCDQIAGLTFNGDDAIVLECGAAVIDAIGQVGFDPGTSWGSGELSLLDHTLRRQCAASADTDPTDAFDPSAGWSGHALDLFEDLGLWACP